MTALLSLVKAKSILNAGGVLAYPTEAVYGLGCDAFNEPAVRRILALKQRESSKGFIVLVHDWKQLNELIAPISAAQMQKVRATWPGPVTWIFPKAAHIPAFLSGEHATLAIRMTAHPIASALCEERPIISTSANRTTESPARDVESIVLNFGDEIDGIVQGNLGDLTQPSTILDVITSQKLR